MRQQASIIDPYRWVILSLILLTNISSAVIQLSGAPVQLTIAAEMGLNAAQIATWINLPLLAIALFSIPAGIGIDYFGARKGLTVGLLFMAIFGVARGGAPSFPFLCVVTFLFGVGQALMLSGMPKAVVEWFPPSQIGRAIGVYTSGAAIGTITVFLIAPALFLNNWRGLFLAAGGLASIACLAWLVLGRSRVHSPGTVSRTRLRHMGGTLLRVASQKDVLILVGICACTQVGMFSWFAFGFPFLVLVKGATEQTAGAVVSVTMVGFLIGALVVAPLSDKIGRRRPFFFFGGTLSGLLLLLIYFLPLGFLVWGAVFLIGGSLGVLQVLLFAIPLELEGVSEEEVGACEGLIISLGFLAGILASPILGRVLGDFETTIASNFLLVFGLLGGVMLIGAVLAMLLRETGWKSPNATMNQIGDS